MRLKCGKEPCVCCPFSEQPAIQGCRYPLIARSFAVGRQTGSVLWRCHSLLPLPFCERPAQRGGLSGVAGDRKTIAWPWQIQKPPAGIILELTDSNPLFPVAPFSLVWCNAATSNVQRKLEPTLLLVRFEMGKNGQRTDSVGKGHKQYWAGNGLGPPKETPGVAASSKIISSWFLRKDLPRNLLKPSRFAALVAM